jgi:hypothetical protein
MARPTTDGPEIHEDRWIPSACTICYGGCSILAHRVNGTVVKIEGNPRSPVGNGHICAKGLAGPMLLYDPHRVNTPLRRTNLTFGWAPPATHMLGVPKGNQVEPRVLQRFPMLKVLRDVCGAKLSHVQT